MEDQNDGFAEDDNIAEDLERAFADEPIRQDDDDDDDDESTQEEEEALDDFRDNPMATAYGISKATDSSTSSHSQNIIRCPKY